MEFDAILAYLMTLAPWVSYLFMGLGTLVLIGTIVDSLVDDEKDGGFMKKILATPILGSLLEALRKFSPLNVKPKDGE